MSEYDDKMKKLREAFNLPGEYKLTGTEAGTGTVTAPKGMTTKQALAYDKAIQERMNPRDPKIVGDVEEYFKNLKRQAQSEHTAKIGKKRPSFFPSEESSPKLEGFFKKIGMESDPVSGDELTSTEKSQNKLNQFEDTVDEYMKTGNYDTREEAEKELFALTSTSPGLKSGAFGLAKKNPIETAGDVYAPYAHEGVDTSDEYEREEFGMDASEEQFQKEYEDQEPVSTSQTEVDGDDGWTKLEYEDGAIWLMSPDGDVVRQEDVQPYKATFDSAAKEIDTDKFTPFREFQKKKKMEVER